VGVNAEYNLDGSADAPLLTIQGNTITGANVGLYLAALATGSVVGGSTPEEANSIDVTAGGAGAAGIIIEYSKGSVTVEGNSVTASGDGMGIILFDDDTNAVLLTGNTLSSSGSLADSSGDAAGILVTDDNALSTLGEPGPLPTSDAVISGGSITGFATGVLPAVTGRSGYLGYG
jgi:hypothetical protein